MTRVIQTLEKRIDDLENRSRRSNLIIYGLPEAQSETTETLEQAVNKDVIQDKLKLQPIAIERIHRLGKPAPNKTRPVILKLVDSRQKEAILKNGKRLKGTNYAIGEDFCRKTREIRKKLWDSAKPNRDKKEKVALAFERLYINDCAFVWDEEKEERVPLNKPKNYEIPTRPNTRSTTQNKK